MFLSASLVLGLETYTIHAYIHTYIPSSGSRDTYHMYIHISVVLGLETHTIHAYIHGS